MSSTFSPRNFVKAAALLLAVTLGAAACGSGGTEDASSQPPPQNETGTETPVPVIEGLDTTGAQADGGGLDLVPADVSTQVATINRPGYTYDPWASGAGWESITEYLNFVLTDVHSFWTDVEVSAGNPAPEVSYLWSEPGVSYQTTCQTTNDRSAFYCPQDDLIVISQQMAIDIWNGSYVAGDGKAIDGVLGDFAVAFLVAHEYAHNLQDEYGLLAGYAGNTVPFERHADCWAGAWTRNAYYEGILDYSDISEALDTAWLVSDTRADGERSHGTPEERQADFLLGYNSGHPSGCDTILY